MSIHIEYATCDLCGTCISVCPCNALLFTPRLEVDDTRCTRCGTCVDICPFAALSLEK